MSKKIICLFLLLSFALCAVGCAEQKEPDVTETFSSGFRTYEKLDDGTWQCDGIRYQYRLELTGRIPSASMDSTFVYLSNIPEITFRQAYLAAGLSSYSKDYFDVNDAVLVEWR